MNSSVRFTARTLAACILALPLGCASHGSLDDAAGKPVGRLQRLNEEVCRDTETGLMWQVKPSPASFASWKEASQYARELVLGVYTDWRLPTYDELYELCDLFARMQQGDCAMRQEIPVWYGEAGGEGRAGYWTPYPTCGGVDYEFVRRKQGRVRAVRP